MHTQLRPMSVILVVAAKRLDVLMSPTRERLEAVGQVAFWSDYSSFHNKIENDVQDAIEILERKETQNTGLPASALARRISWLHSGASGAPNSEDAAKLYDGMTPPQTAIAAANMVTGGTNYNDSPHMAEHHEVESGRRCIDSSPEEAAQMRFPLYLTISLAFSGFMTGLVVASLASLEMSAFATVYLAVAGLGLGASSIGFAITLNKSRQVRNS